LKVRPRRESRLRWSDVSQGTREGLERKIRGLYGAADERAAFDNLEIDKQQSLLLLMRRLQKLSLWELVRRVENVYGEGGVGMGFRAWPGLLSELQRRRDFTTRFASHRESAGGFIERGCVQASLHFLYQEKGERIWAVHFDLYNPWSSPLNALRHLFYEKIKGTTPDWRMVRACLRQEGKLY
jgi:hypothetical protein